MSDRTRPTSIPGVETLHRREVIEAHSMPIEGPPSDQRVWDTLALHYTAADDLIDGDAGEHADQLDEYLGGIQRYYENARGYSIGYQFAVDWLGGVWELRGFDIQCAANRGWNTRTLAILCLVDGSDPVTDAAADSINAVWLEANKRSGRTLTIRPHSAIGSTSCPGDGIRKQIAAGKFRPELTNPKPLPTPEGDDMKPHLWKHKDHAATFYVEGADVLHVDGKEAQALTSVGVPTWISDNEDVYQSRMYLHGGPVPVWVKA